MNNQIHPFLAHLSWKLKWAFLIACRPLFVCPSVHLSVYFYFFPLLLKNHWANFNQTWHKASLGKRDTSLFNEEPFPFARGDNCKVVKLHWRNLKIFFPRTTGPISTKLGTNHPWVKGIQVSLNNRTNKFS